ncbi:hypothetical protein HII36_25295 [Nonomuraea sp. NN258]|uniref:hypothetical protein n=1 Tax=Nonomuraea antri TaxID=2730852 RepID=UPI0015687983|nr:hypothetical protein [Nonomuraea antri]NRQ35115.1 hypothetical protein [Nonomuraea antri]
MKRGCLLTVVLAVGLPIVGLFLLINIPMWLNDRKLDDFESGLRSYPRPPQTYVVDNTTEKSIALRGNGNHCDYLVRMAFSSSLSEDEIVAYYDAAKIAGVDGDGRASVTVYFPRKRAAAATGPSRTFLVEIADGTEAGLDFRCH